MNRFTIRRNSLHGVFIALDRGNALQFWPANRRVVIPGPQPVSIRVANPTGRATLVVWKSWRVLGIRSFGCAVPWINDTNIESRSVPGAWFSNS